jgi:hypothetical protein
MTIGPCLKMGGPIGIVMIVAGFFMWFFLSEYPSSTDDVCRVT